MSATRRKPHDGSTHWSCRKLASVLGVSKDAVHRVWKEAGLKPHRLERYMASDDPEFETKAADILGLYLHPPQHAAVFCLDEKTAIQALDRLDPVLPLSPGRAERHGFEYYRHGTLSLYAALNTATGRVHGKTAARHTSREFVAFLHEVVGLCPPRQRIHIILDNLSAHKTQAVRDFLQKHPRVRFHFTPTYSSWLNQVEIWFAKIEREVIARGIFTSVSDLARKLRRYINAYSANARPIQWKYSDPTRRVRGNDFTATGHYVVYVRGEAYMSAHQGAEAATEFQKIVDCRVVVLSDPVGASRDCSWVGHTRWPEIRPRQNPLIRISSRFGKTPTRTSRS